MWFMSTAKSKKPKKLKITVGKTKRYNGLIGIVPNYSHMGSTRHIGTNAKKAEPICGADLPFYGHWIASTGKKMHERPLCRNCLRVLERINNAVAQDPMRTSEEERFQKSLEGLQEIIAEYGEWFEDADGDG